MKTMNLWQWTCLAALVSATAALGGCQQHGGNLQFTGTTPVDFGNVLVFSTSPPIALSWRNVGTQATEMDGVVLQRNTPMFAVSGTFPGVTLNPGATSQPLGVTFTPTTVGPATSWVKPFGPWALGVVRPQIQQADLKGNGVAYIAEGGISIGGVGTPGQILDFGSVQKGTTSSPQVIFVIYSPSIGAAAPPIAVTVKWSRNNQGFASTPAQGGSLVVPPYVPIPVPITFTPPDVGDYTDSVQFADASGRRISGTMVKGKGVNVE